MYIVKEKPDLSIEGKIENLFEIKNNTLTVGDKLKYENDKWYILGGDKKWYFIGYSGVPDFKTEEYIDSDLFNNVFTIEEIEIREDIE